jgi:hypothetical protein
MKDFCAELESSGATFIKRKFKHATLASLVKLLNNDVMPEETSTEWLSYVLNKKDIDHEVDWIKNSRMQMPGATQVFSDRLMKEIYNSMSYCAQYKASVWKGTDSPLKTLLDRWPHDEVVGLVGKDTRDWIRLPFTEMDKTWSLNCETQTLSFTYKGKMREFKYQWPSNTWKYTGNDAGIGLFYPRQRWPTKYESETERWANYEFMNRYYDADRYEDMSRCINVHIDKSGDMEFSQTWKKTDGRVVNSYIKYWKIDGKMVGEEKTFVFSGDASTTTTVSYKDNELKCEGSGCGGLTTQSVVLVDALFDPADGNWSAKGKDYKAYCASVLVLM